MLRGNDAHRGGVNIRGVGAKIKSEREEVRERGHRRNSRIDAALKERHRRELKRSQK